MSVFSRGPSIGARSHGPDLDFGVVLAGVDTAHKGGGGSGSTFPFANCTSASLLFALWLDREVGNSIRRGRNTKYRGEFRPEDLLRC
jgi:hypothetical protein